MKSRLSVRRLRSDRSWVNQLFSIAVVVLLTGCAGPPSPVESLPEGWGQFDLSVDGRRRTYASYTPTDGDPRGLMVVLHGSGQSVGHMIGAVEAESVADERGVVVVVPAGTNGGWNDEDPPDGDQPDDVAFIDALVMDVTTAHPSIPPDHVFAHGFSNGGGLATRLACESRYIRGVGVVGNYYVPIGDECLRPVGHPVPGWFGAGGDDEVVPVEAVRERIPDYAVDLTECPTTGRLQPVASGDVPSGDVCMQMTDCAHVRLCEYRDRGHEVLPGSVLAAWSFLSESVQGLAN